MADTKTASQVVLEEFASKYAKRADFVGLGEPARADMFREFARDVRNDLLPAILAQQAATPADDAQADNQEWREIRAALRELRAALNILVVGKASAEPMRGLARAVLEDLDKLTVALAPAPSRRVALSIEQGEAICEVIALAVKGLPGTAEMLASILRATNDTGEGLYTMDQMRDYADAFHRSRTEATGKQGLGMLSIVGDRHLLILADGNALPDGDYPLYTDRHE